MAEQEDMRDVTTGVVETFQNTFEKGNLVDTFSQVGEFAIDQAIKNDVLKDIPVFGLLVSGYKTIANVKNYYLTRKVYRFLYNLQKTTPEERQKFSKDYCEANQEKTAVSLLNILDQLNNGNLVPIICNLMKAVIKEELTVAQFNRLVMAIQKTAYTDLTQLVKYQEEYDEDGLSDALVASGLIYQSTYDGGTAEGDIAENKFMISPNGMLLLKYGLKVENVQEKPRNTEISPGMLWSELQ